MFPFSAPGVVFSAVRIKGVPIAWVVDFESVVNDINEVRAGHLFAVVGLKNRITPVEVGVGNTTDMNTHAVNKITVAIVGNVL
jgi:hypothetical protein